MVGLLSSSFFFFSGGARLAGGDVVVERLAFRLLSREINGARERAVSQARVNGVEEG